MEGADQYVKDATGLETGNRAQGESGNIRVRNGRHRKGHKGCSKVRDR